VTKPRGDRRRPSRQPGKQATRRQACERANALILTYCKSIKDISGADPADKQSALKRYGEQVISALQGLAEAAQSKPAPEGK
jgi:hypothetical protein